MYILLFFLVLAFSLQAQPIVLTEEKAIELALQKRLELKYAAAGNEAARAKLSQIRSRYIPQVSAQISLQYNAIIPSSIIPIGQFNPVNPTDETRSVQFGLPWSNTAGISASQVIFDPALSALYDETEIELQKAGIGMQSGKRAVIYDIKQAWLNVLLLSREMELAMSDSNRLAGLLELTKNAYQAGKIYLSDVQLAQSALNTSAYSVGKARLAYQNGIQNLIFLLGMPAETQLIIQDSLQIIPLQQVIEDTSGLSQAPDIRLAASDYSLFLQKADNERKKLYPSVFVQGFLGANQFDRSFNPFTGSTWFGNSNIALLVQIPITGAWQAMQSAAEFEQSAIAANAEQYRLLLKARNELNRCIKSARLAYDYYASQQQVTDLARSVRAQITERYSAGQTGMNEVLNAEFTLQNAMYQLLRSVYDYRHNLAEAQFIRALY
jgi:outer membrane protein TolC